MLKTLPFWIGLRYTRSKKRNHFISFISLSSMIGIALGVMVLITVLSVMNGFDEEIHKRFFGIAPEITINGNGENIKDWQAIEKKALSIPGVRAAAPFVGGQGMASYRGQVLPMVITGILPDKEQGVSRIDDKILAGDIGVLKPYGIVLGRSLADSLNVRIDDKVTVMIPQASVTPAGMIPRFKRFTVVGVFDAGAGFNFNQKLAFIDMHDAQKLFQTGSAVTGMKLKLDKIYSAPQIANDIAAMIGDAYLVGDWTQQFGAFFQAIKLEKTMMFFILLLIIAVAAFNLVSSLVMVVNDKQSEIAILRTLGATPSTILAIFIVQGMMVGILGTGIGLLMGILLAHNAPNLVDWLQTLFDIQVFSSNVYFVDHLPSKIIASDLVKICSAAMLMCFIATIYPAWRASRTLIAEALHYE